MAQGFRFRPSGSVRYHWCSCYIITIRSSGSDRLLLYFSTGYFFVTIISVLIAFSKKSGDENKINEELKKDKVKIDQKDADGKKGQPEASIEACL